MARPLYGLGGVGVIVGLVFLLLYILYFILYCLLYWSVVVIIGGGGVWLFAFAPGMTGTGSAHHTTAIKTRNK